MTQRHNCSHRQRQEYKKIIPCQISVKNHWMSVVLLLLCLNVVQVTYITYTMAQESNSSNQLAADSIKNDQNLSQSGIVQEMVDDSLNYEDLSLSYVHSHDLTPLYQNYEPKYSALDFQSNPESDLDLSSLLDFQNVKSKQSSLEWESALLMALRSLPNLRVKSPVQHLRKLEKSLAVKRLIKLAHDFIRHSNQAYKLVDLERAQVLLDSAIELLIQARYTLTNPQKMALLYLRRGVVAVEQKQFLLAAVNFREALLLAPNLRLKKGFDRPDTIEVFENKYVYCLIRI